MKTTIDWRRCVICALCCIGMFSFMLIFGEDERPIGVWILSRAYLALASAVCFYIAKRLRLYWSVKAK